MTPGDLLQFEQAVRSGDVLLVQDWISRHKRLVNHRFGEGVTPLMLATAVADDCAAPNLVNLLLRSGAQIATRDDRRRHALLYACEHRACPAVIELLVHIGLKGARNDALRWSHCDEQRRNALELACRSGRLDLVQCLIRLHPNFVEKMSLQVLRESCLTGNQAIVLYLLSLKSFENFDGEVDDNAGYDDEFSGVDFSPYECVALLAEMVMTDSIEEIWKGNKSICRSLWNYVHSTTDCDVQIPAALLTIAQSYPRQVLEKRRAPILSLLSGTSKKLNPHWLAAVPQVIFKIIGEFIFVFDADEQHQESIDDEHFKRSAKWCSECEGWFIIGTCFC